MGVENSDANPYIQGSNGIGSISKKLLLNPFGGDVGIGTTNPLGKLSIEGASATNYATHIVFNNTSGEKDFALGAGIHGSTNSGFGIIDRNTNNAFLYINNGGNVGINTSNPGSYKLNVNGTLKILVASHVCSEQISS